LIAAIPIWGILTAVLLIAQVLIALVRSEALRNARARNAAIRSAQELRILVTPSEACPSVRFAQVVHSYPGVKDAMELRTAVHYGVQVHCDWAAAHYDLALHCGSVLHFWLVQKTRSDLVELHFVD
jgi:hypothetical protein